jgi:serine/threonine protein kinase
MSFSTEHASHDPAGAASFPWRLFEIIGEGGCSRVWRGMTIASGEIVAVKASGRTHSSPPDGRRASTLPDDNEFQILSALQQANIPQVFNYFATDTMIYISLQYIRGIDVMEELMNEGALPEPAVRRRAQQVVSAVAYIHECDLVHRDIKPQNLMVASRHGAEIILLIDFGFTKRPPCSTLLGTRGYLAPELCDSDRSTSTTWSYSTSVDMWALGVTLYEMLSATPPFDFEFIAQQTLLDAVSFDAAEWSAVSAGAREVVAQLLIKDVAQRMSSRDICCVEWIEHAS